MFKFDEAGYPKCRLSHTVPNRTPLHAVMVVVFAEGVVVVVVVVGLVVVFVVLVVVAAVAVVVVAVVPSKKKLKHLVDRDLAQVPRQKD